MESGLAGLVWGNGTHHGVWPGWFSMGGIVLAMESGLAGLVWGGIVLSMESGLAGLVWGE